MGQLLEKLNSLVGDFPPLGIGHQFFQGRGWKTSGRGYQNSAHSEGGGMKNKEHFKRDYGVSSEALEWGSKYLHKSERGDENSIKYMRMSSTPSPQVINDPSLILHGDALQLLI